MATINVSIALLPGGTAATDSGHLFAEIRDFWRQFFARAFDPYRPELHYMRGPGPACRAKQMARASHRLIRHQTPFDRGRF